MRRNLSALIARLRFDADDPQRYLHVGRKDRLTNDPHDGTDDATDPITGETGTGEVDREAVRQRGNVAEEWTLT